MTNSENLRYFSRANKDIVLGEQKDNMINSLAGKLGISAESAKKLSELKTITDISVLKKELGKIKVDKTKYDEKEELNQIFYEIQNIQKLQEEYKSKARIEIASLKEVLEIIPEYKIASSDSLSTKYLSNENFAKIENGEDIQANLAGIGIGTMDSAYSIVNYAKDLVVGIVKSPVDLYKIASGKAEIDSFKNV